MQITVTRSEFAPAFAWAYKGLPKHAVVPVLFGILVAVEEGTLTLSTFDYEAAHVARARSMEPGMFTEPGRILVKGPDLKQIVGTLPKAKNTPITLDDLDGDGQALAIHAGGISYSLPALPLDEYPALPPLPPLAGIVDGPAFARSVGRVAKAAGRDDTLPLLLTMALTPSAAALHMEATDRYRLALDDLPWTPASETPAHGPFLVPAGMGGYRKDGIATFAKGTTKSAAVKIYLGTDEAGTERAGFADDWHTLIIATTSGTWIKTSAILRDDSPVTLTVDAAALAAVVRNVGRVTRPNMPAIFTYSAAASTLTVMAQGDGGKVAMSQTIPAVADAIRFWVGFNPAYLASMLEGFTGQVEVGLGGKLPAAPKPAVLRPADPAETFTAIVMPQRLETGTWTPPAGYEADAA